MYWQPLSQGDLGTPGQPCSKALRWSGAGRAELLSLEKRMLGGSNCHLQLKIQLRIRKKDGQALEGVARGCCGISVLGGTQIVTGEGPG